MTKEIVTKDSRERPIASPITTPSPKITDPFKPDPNVPPPPSSTGKRTTLTFISGNRWDVRFEGPITRRDILRLQRVLMIEFAKAERRRSARKLIPLMISNTQVETQE